MKKCLNYFTGRSPVSLESFRPCMLENKKKLPIQAASFSSFNYCFGVGVAVGGLVTTGYASVLVGANVRVGVTRFTWTFST